MTLVVQGGCLCGRVRFKASGPPMRTLACHCTFCQKVTGTSFYAESLYQRSAVEFNEGELKQFDHTSDVSGKKVHVHFCPNCGTTIGLTFERWPDIRAISRGCLDDPDAVEIGSHIWTRSAQTGVALPHGVDCFDTARATLDGRAMEPTRHAAPVMARGEGSS
ncbi:GFA family protein [Caenimonas aquaedulcis]|uniref:GFA family protein n=1 Tax=Caenimonas aquaedulcis TaxID=2793270 RepID=A0A931H7M3_9BURK|nr:GFA family protein [Caenimonas aquaedulcis]MBG9390101.1 GFA family protein [Caenimonas aquaedulcis]